MASSTPASTDRSICPLCRSFASKNLKGIVRHIGRVYSHDANFHICCGLESGYLGVQLAYDDDDDHDNNFQTDSLHVKIFLV